VRLIPSLAGGALGALILVGLSSPAFAGPRPADGAATGDVQMREVDMATVRVLAIAGVALAEAKGSHTNEKRVVAAVEAGHGSGVVVDGSGIVLTAKHVVADAEILAVRVPGDDKAYAARVIYQDPNRDFAFLAIDGHLPHSLALPRQPRVLAAGEHVTASGYPLDPNQSTPALASGQVSRRTEEGLFELAMSVNPGNSGGPVTDDHGQLLGIIVQGADPTKGAQGIAIAEPLRGILEAYATRVTPAARNQAFDDSDRAVAAAAYELVRTGPFGIAVDPEVHKRLVAIGESKHPAVLAVMGGHVWNMLVGLLEVHSARRPSDITDAHDRRVAEELLGDAVRLCRAAVAIDPSIAERSPFVKVLLSTAAQAGPADDALARQDAPHAAGSSTSDEDVARQPSRDWPRVGLDFMAGTTGDNVAGGVAAMGDVLRLAGDHVGLTLGVEGTLGPWRSHLAGTMLGEVGARASIGGRVRATAALLYTPGFVTAEGRSLASFRAYRAMVGATVGHATYGLTMQEIGRGADDTFRTYGAYVELGF
jgi:V8-like Glu-specific endopeptidase